MFLLKLVETTKARKSHRWDPFSAAVGIQKYVQNSKERTKVYVLIVYIFAFGWCTSVLSIRSVCFYLFIPDHSKI